LAAERETKQRIEEETKNKEEEEELARQAALAVYIMFARQCTAYILTLMLMLNVCVLQAEEDARARLSARLPEEPSTTGAGIATISVRLPAGTKASRRFLESTTMQVN
jgi:hypothetical protein